ncbi:MAG TPA: hypothetical protein VGK02_11995 [Candidatus Aquicultor sp.]|jgi:hypothetical protein
MWIKVAVGNHYGLFEITGIEVYRESETSFLLYGYLPRAVPEVPVTAHESLRDGMTHIDFVKIYEFSNEEDARGEIGKIQSFMNSGSGGVYEVQAESGMGMAKSA